MIEAPDHAKAPPATLHNPEVVVETERDRAVYLEGFHAGLKCAEAYGTYQALQTFYLFHGERREP